MAGVAVVEFKGTSVGELVEFAKTSGQNGYDLDQKYGDLVLQNEVNTLVDKVKDDIGPHSILYKMEEAEKQKINKIYDGNQAHQLTFSLILRKYKSATRIIDVRSAMDLYNQTKELLSSGNTATWSERSHTCRGRRSLIAGGGRGQSTSTPSFGTDYKTGQPVKQKNVLWYFGAQTSESYDMTGTVYIISAPDLITAQKYVFDTFEVPHANMTEVEAHVLSSQLNQLCLSTAFHPLDSTKTGIIYCSNDFHYSE